MYSDILDHMKHIRDRLSALGINKDMAKPDRATERGELMKHFVKQLNSTRKQDGYPEVSMSRMGKILQGIPTKDLYYLKATCDKAKHFSKKFWWEVDPQKHLLNRTDKPF